MIRCILSRVRIVSQTSIPWKMFRRRKRVHLRILHILPVPFVPMILNPLLDLMDIVERIGYENEMTAIATTVTDKWIVDG